MAQEALANTRALLLERVNSALPNMFRQEGPLWSEIKKKKADVVSRRTMRIQLRMSPGGQYRAWNPDGGVMGNGTGMDYEEADLVPSDHLLAGQWTKDVEFNTDSTEKATKNAVKDLVENMMDRMGEALNLSLHTAGGGILATVASFSTPTVTVDSTLLLQEGMPIDIYNAAETTNRGTANIVKITSLTTFTVDAGPGGLTGTDLVVISGMTAAGSITAPVDIYGVPYHHSSATTGTWLGLNRATYNPKLTTPSVNAASGALTVAHLYALRSKMRRALGLGKAKERHACLINVEQVDQYRELAQAVIRIDKTSGEATPDMTFSEDVASIAGYKPLVDQHQDITRIDLLNLDKWGRAELYPIRFHTFPGGSKFFTLIDPTTGTPLASEVCYMEYGGQFFMVNPRDGGFIYGLATPTISIGVGV